MSDDKTSKAARRAKAEQEATFKDGSSVGTTPFSSPLATIMGVLVLVAGLFTRMLWLSSPNQVVFDEVHFGKFTRWYLRREYFFDIHPPLGKFFIWLAAAVTDFPNSFDFNDVGKEMPEGGGYVWLRFMPALFGGSVPLIAYLTCLHMTGSVSAAVLSAALIIFDNGFLVESRLILTDAFLFFFIACALYCNLRLFNEPEWTRKRIVWMILSGLFLGAAPSVKWTGLCVVGMCGLGHVSHVLHSLWVAIRSYPAHVAGQKSLRVLLDALITGATLVTLMVSVYLMSFVWHFKWANREGDNWMTKERLPSDEEIARMPPDQRPSFWVKLFHLHYTMFELNATVDQDHPYCSSWETWPFMQRGVAYWGIGNNINIYMIGNALVWWGTTTCIAIFFLDMLRVGAKHIRLPVLEEAYLKRGRFLMLGHLLNLLPYIKVSRCAYLYHYLPSLYFASILAGVVLAYWLRDPTFRVIGVATVVALIAWSFCYFAPFTYGLELTDEQREARMWSPNWV